MNNIEHLLYRPLTSATVSFLLGKFLYGNTAIVMNNSTLSVASALAMAGFGGNLISNLSHDNIFSSLHIDERWQNLASVGVNTGILYGADLLVFSMINSDAYRDIDKTKLLMECAGSVVASDYLYTRFLKPLWTDDSSY